MKMISKIFEKEPLFKLENLHNKESMSQISNTKNDLLKLINYKLKYKNIKKILETNKKWFKKIY